MEFVSETIELVEMARTLKYSNPEETSPAGLWHESNPESTSLECYADADFGGCLKTGRSRSGVVIKYSGGAFLSSTTEAELVIASEAVKEIVWLNRLFRKIARIPDVPILKIDNSAAIRLVQNPECHRRTKHISNKRFFIGEKLAEE
ncbi:hypothetical protein GWI33_007166 [Rhynchophorus ferrugineus]|uniref:Gag-pol polyprotein n=1 Tax=Rhynchophorus ferrugineus TaxID=354439 RepID=A0A834IRX4_RHYFE|nr:hypothetical protein GWI33_007166 [Rhynchophorus ferrugineus]